MLDLLNTNYAYVIVRICLFLEAIGIADGISLLLEIYFYRRNSASLLPQATGIELTERSTSSICSDYMKYVTLVSPLEVTSLETLTRCCEVLRGTLRNRRPCHTQRTLRKGLRMCVEGSNTYSILRPWREEELHTSASALANKLRRAHKPVPCFLLPKSHPLHVPPHLVVMGGILQLGQIGKEEKRGYRPIPV